MSTKRARSLSSAEDGPEAQKIELGHTDAAEKQFISTTDEENTTGDIQKSTMALIMCYASIKYTTGWVTLYPDLEPDWEELTTTRLHASLTCSNRQDSSHIDTVATLAAGLQIGRIKVDDMASKDMQRWLSTPAWCLYSALRTSYGVYQQNTFEQLRSCLRHLYFITKRASVPDDVHGEYGLLLRKYRSCSDFMREFLTGIPQVTTAVACVDICTIHGRSWYSIGMASMLGPDHFGLDDSETFGIASFMTTLFRDGYKVKRCLNKSNGDKSENSCQEVKRQAIPIGRMAPRLIIETEHLSHASRTDLPPEKLEISGESNDTSECIKEHTIGTEGWNPTLHSRRYDLPLSPNVNEFKLRKVERTYTLIGAIYCADRDHYTLRLARPEGCFEYDALATPPARKVGTIGRQDPGHSLWAAVYSLDRISAT